MTETEPPRAELIPGESVVRRPARAIIGWLNQQEAVPMLLGRGPAANEDTKKLITQAEEYAAAVANRPGYNPVDPLVTDHTYTDALAEVAQRSAVQANFHNLNWNTAVVDLTKVLSFQKVIFTDDTPGDPAGTDVSNLLRICLPSDQPIPPSGAIGDPDGKGFTISSLNSNLRIAGGQLSEANVSQAPGEPSVRMQAVTLFVSMGTSYLQVIHYRSRYFLRDGYHRAAKLLRSGITIVPCIYIDARSFEDFQAPNGALSYETLYGDRPPSLKDFWDDSVSAEISQLAIRKVIRIRGEEFAVPR
jgi:hypothetical protein